MLAEIIQKVKADAQCKLELLELEVSELHILKLKYQQELEALGLALASSKDVSKELQGTISKMEEKSASQKAQIADFRSRFIEMKNEFFVQKAELDRTRGEVDRARGEMLGRRQVMAKMELDFAEELTRLEQGKVANEIEMEKAVSENIKLEQDRSILRERLQESNKEAAKAQQKLAEFTTTYEVSKAEVTKQCNDWLQESEKRHTRDTEAVGKLLQQLQM